ncbi:MAG: AAA family ATPase, partial [Sulfurospirillaceae bacterium]|nr:AAA family ATPase [Sulfurospirillaceae bacterium]
LVRHDKYNKQRLAEIKKIVSKCDLIVIDEISMVSADLLDMVQYRLRNANFKGSVLFVGDFFQLPPVFSKANENALFSDAIYAFEGSSWSFFNPIVVELTKTKRTEDKDFFEILKKIRQGNFDESILTYLEGLRGNDDVWGRDPTVLFGRNKEADLLNREKLLDIDAMEITLKAKETLHEKSLNIQKIDGWKKSLPIAPDLTLKVGAKVLFCTNKWGKYYNGERGVVVEIDDEYVLVEKSDALVKVERQPYVMYENVVLRDTVEEKPLFSLEQFPLKLAYAVTIHKSQGMSIDTLVCNIDNIFENSQFYVALSRAKNPSSLLLHYTRFGFEKHLQRCIQVSDKVKDFYTNAKTLKIEENSKK